MKLQIFYINEDAGAIDIAITISSKLCAFRGDGPSAGVARAFKEDTDFQA